jgi:hypothetical protein
MIIVAVVVTLCLDFASLYVYNLGSKIAGIKWVVVMTSVLEKRQGHRRDKNN